MLVRLQTRIYGGKLKKILIFGFIIALLCVVACSVKHTNIQNVRPLDPISNAIELGQVGTVLTRTATEGSARLQDRAYQELLRVAKGRFPDWPIVDVRAISLESFDEGEQRNMLTATGTVVVYHRSKLLTPLEKATEDALLVALERANISKSAKLSIHSARIADAEIGNKSFDTVEQSLFNQGFTNIVDRLDMNITRSEQDLRAGFESNDQSLAGFFVGADYIVTVRSETNRTTVRILDAKTSTVIGRSSRWY
jgi:hypothetical protein